MDYRWDQPVCFNPEGCPGQACSASACWVREGYRMAVDTAREAVQEDGAPGWLPGRLCEVASHLLPDWDWTGPDYSPRIERFEDTVKRGEVWTTGGGIYTGKPRPAVVVQDGAHRKVGSVTLCPMTTLAADAPAMRIRVDPTPGNGLEHTSFVMVDKVTTTSRTRVHTRLGVLSDEHMAQIEKALMGHLFATA